MLAERPLAGLSLMTEADFLRAALPLLSAGEVEVMEWSFDMCWGETPPAPVVQQILETYSREGRLLGHGVSYSLLSGEWTARHQAWIELLEEEVKALHYRHISEHFGFMSAGDFHRSAPLPVPLTESILEMGQERMQILADHAGVPVGLENLAFAFSLYDVAKQGEFLDRLLEPVDGFMIMDLHNLYCLSVNFDVELELLIQRYPLDRVRELHISGGSWAEVPSEETPIRRDTHDEAVPEEIFDILPRALELCPNVEAVIFERIGNTLSQDTDAKQFQSDFGRMKEIIIETSYAETASAASAVSGSLSGHPGS